MTLRLRPVFLGILPFLTLVGCGARTELSAHRQFAPVEDAGIDVSSPPLDAGADARDASDGGHDTGVDTGIDTGVDAGTDAPLPPPEDAGPAVCADASDLLIYGVTTASSLVRFDPATLTFTRLGTLQCSGQNATTPYSMAVDHSGLAYVEYSTTTSTTAVFRLSLATGACSPVQLNGLTQGFSEFGMGFSVDDGGATETMYLAASGSGDLGAVSESTLALTAVIPTSPAMPEAELSGTQDGRLFAFSGPQAGGFSTSVIVQLDRTTGSALTTYPLPSVAVGSGWAFAYWGGDFYMFTAPNYVTGTVVTRFRPSDNSIVDVATYPEIIDGAGASTCAPQAR